MLTGEMPFESNPELVSLHSDVIVPELLQSKWIEYEAMLVDLYLWVSFQAFSMPVHDWRHICSVWVSQMISVHSLMMQIVHLFLLCLVRITACFVGHIM